MPRYDALIGRCWPTRILQDGYALAALNRAELLSEQAALRALTWKDSRVTARLEALYRLLDR
jgi:hypothetical protein